jgi:hypothetical protein
LLGLNLDNSKLLAGTLLQVYRPSSKESGESSASRVSINSGDLLHRPVTQTLDTPPAATYNLGKLRV